MTRAQSTRGEAFIRGGWGVLMITKGAVFITGWRSFEAWRLVEEKEYLKFNFHVNHSVAQYGDILIKLKLLIVNGINNLNQEQFIFNQKELFKM